MHQSTMENCLGELDETYIKVNVPQTVHPRVDGQSFAASPTTPCKLNVAQFYHFVTCPETCLDERGGGDPRGCLVELVFANGWKSNNDMFKLGYLAQLVHLAMKCLMNKPFPYYDKLSYLFGKDRAMGGRMETFVDVGSNDASGYKRFPPKDGINMDIPTMIGSSGSKRKRRGHNVKFVDVIRDVMEYANDQLRAIAEWPKLAL
ncbi:retrotransposon protein [Cucumis melo var. makuwa]|uniref:Retrotransposon protein n=1 Tax=Cucumis melo var. makuwa TaxID=1194695 RepID=A0A5A7VIP8_CUCMM|nr:retrotransposon protein [Cucumis melo var. makuwa]TYK01436.1 retrotransposon protein [Cucumis melo var. makuwa]